MADSRNGEIDGKIAAWLADQGYPLEMRVARSLRQAGFSVRQAHYYVDPEEAAAREIDVLARLYSFAEPEGYVAIAELETFVALECKSGAKPWVVFCETPPEAWRFKLAVGDAAGAELLRLAGTDLRATEVHRRATQAGHGVVQAFRDRSDVAFRAMMSAVKAAYSQAVTGTEVGARLASDPARAHMRELSVTFPVVLIDTPLFECRLGVDGEPTLASVGHSAVALGYMLDAGSRLEAGTIVHIVCESDLAEFGRAVVEFHKVLSSKLATMIPREGQKQ